MRVFGFIAMASWIVGVLPTVAKPTEHTFYVSLSGLPNHAPFVTHGNSGVTGTATFVVDDVANTIDWKIEPVGNSYQVTQAHVYNVNPSSSFYKPNGESIFCWGGRWSSHDFLEDSGFSVSSARVSDIISNPDDWMLIVHTRGGHFANEGSGLIPYSAATHETNDIGATESGDWFNNRIGKRLDDLTLREDNPHDTADNTYWEGLYGAGYFGEQASSPFADALGNEWVEPDGSGGWQLTAAAIAAGYDLSTEYLYYRYADDGNDWDYGASEGAFGGVFQVSLPSVSVPEPSQGMLLAVALATMVGRRLR